MPCLISDIALDLAPDGTAEPVVGAKITAASMIIPLFELVAGAMREQRDPQREALTDVNGAWQFLLPFPSEQDPQSAQWGITTPDDFTWVGLVPEGVAGPITLWDLKNLYGWAVASNRVTIPIAIAGIPGPVGPPGPFFSGPLVASTTDATLTNIALPAPITQGIYLYELRIGAQLADGTIGRAWRAELAVMRNASGAVTIMGALDTFSDESSATGADVWQIGATIVSGVPQIQVTGAAATAINWTVKYAIA